MIYVVNKLIMFQFDVQAPPWKMETFTLVETHEFLPLFCEFVLLNQMFCSSRFVELCLFLFHLYPVY
jgi:hypothetical protein